MDPEDLKELHYVTPIKNLESIMSRGILSHRLAKKMPHDSVAMEEIQTRRAKKVVPGGRRLHEYANLYINARNKMMSKLVFQFGDKDFCVLRVATEVLDLPGVVVTDQNASSNYALFEPAPRGMRIVDSNLVFARSWKHPENVIEEFRHGSVICAEVLVPDRIDAEFLLGLYVSCQEAKTKVTAAGVGLQVRVNPDLFFR